MNLLKLREEKAFPFLGQEIRLQFRAPTYDDAPAFLKRMNEYGMAAKRAKEARDAGDRTAGADLFSLLEPEFVRKTFEACVKPAPDQFVEADDGGPKPLVTGLDVYEIANSVLVLAVMNEIQSRAVLSLAEGKASSSPSTSGAGAGMATPDSGGSPANSIEPEDGTGN